VGSLTGWAGCHPYEHSQRDACGRKPEIEVPDGRGRLHPVNSQHTASQQRPFSPGAWDAHRKNQRKYGKDQDVQEIHVAGFYLVTYFIREVLFSFNRFPGFCWRFLR
jgi:hypothetical protein